MKKTKLLIIAAFVLAIGSAFTTKNIHPAFTAVLKANPSSHLPCTSATATCGSGSAVCSDGSGNDFYDTNDTGCITPLQHS